MLGFESTSKKLLAATLGLAVGWPIPAVVAQEAFRDDFLQLDTERWYISDGWSNGDWQACTWSSDMVSVEDGMLRLTLAPSDNAAAAAPAGVKTPYLCGEIQTNDIFHYGTYEARIRTDAASGVNSAFFTYIGPVHEQSHNEIDVEILTRNTRRVEFNTYRDGAPAYGTAVPIPDGSTTDSEFHTYAFIWEKEQLRWYVDGMLLHEATGSNLPELAQKIYLSQWNTLTLTDWMGEFVDPGRPLVMEIDWVAYTPLGADCQVEGSILCEDGVSD